MRGLRDAGSTIVFTNGRNDLLHVEHLRSLQSTHELGDYLIVAVNSDILARRHKDCDYLIVIEPERSELLLALSCIDHVFISTIPRLSRLLETIRPHIYCEGGLRGPKR